MSRVHDGRVSGRAPGALSVPVERGPAAELKAGRHLPLASPVTASGGITTPATKEHTMSEQPAQERAHGSASLNPVKTLNYQELRMMVEAAASYRRCSAA